MSTSEIYKDYHTFGSPMPGRQFSAGSPYKYGFNGKENDPETVETGSGTQDYGMRIYNPSLGKFLSVDPITKQYPELTPYQFASNRPICAIDKDGLEAEDVGANIEFLVIVVQGLGDKTDFPLENRTQVDNAGKDNPDNGRDNILGSIKSNYFGQKSQVVTFASSPQKTTEADVAKTVQTYKVNNPNGKVILIGHSLGGYNIENVVKNNSKTEFDLLILLDPSGYDMNNGAGLGSQRLFDNVKNVINYYASNVKSGTSGAQIEFSEKTNGANIFIPGTSHTGIDNKMLKNVILDVLRFINGVDPVEKAKDRDNSKISDPTNNNNGGTSNY